MTAAVARSPAAAPPAIHGTCDPAVEPERGRHRESNTTPRTTSAVPIPRTSVSFSARNSADPMTVTIGYADVAGATWLAGPLVRA